MTSSLTSETLSSVEAICRIADEWRALHARCGNGLFVGYAWFRLWWDTLGERQGWEPHVVVVRQNGRLVGILALAVKRSCGLRVLEWAGNELFDYCDALSETPEVAQALWACVQQSKGIDVFCLRDVRSDSLSFPVLASFARQARSNSVLSIKLEKISGEAWFQSLPGGQRRNLRRHRKRLEERGPVRFEVIRQGFAPETAIQALVEHKLAWCRRTGMPGIFSEENIKDIFLRMSRLAAEQGQLFLCILRCSEKPVAYRMGFIHDGVFYDYALTYDAAWAVYSPGSLSLIETVKWAVENGISEFDFMRGDEGYKQQFANKRLALASFLFSRSLRGWIYVKGLMLGWRIYDKMRSYDKAQKCVAWFRAAGAKFTRAHGQKYKKSP